MYSKIFKLFKVKDVLCAGKLYFRIKIKLHFLRKQSLWDFFICYLYIYSHPIVNNSKEN